MCVSPYIALSKAGDKVCVPCGHCIQCLKDWQTSWTFRLTQEMKRCVLPVFITLTYNDEHLPIGDVDGEPQSVVLKSDVQKFIKRLRRYGGNLMEDCRYFALGEYGSRTNRSHYHIVLMAPNLKYVSEIRPLVEKAWSLNGEMFGFISVNFCTQKRVHYVCKYMNKLDRRPHLVKPFRLFSKSIGLNFLTQKMIEYYLTTFDRTCINGKAHISLPRYYRKKLDELSERHPLLKRAGLSYSDLVDDVYKVPGTQYYLFDQFSKNYDKIYNECVDNICFMSNCFNYSWFEPTRQQVFKYYVRCHKVLSDLIFESERQLSQCVIRNRLEGLHPISGQDLNELLI